MKTDLELKNDVLAELAWDPVLGAAAVDVAVQDGVVSLTGHVETNAHKRALQKAVGRVAGVRGVVLDVDVRLAPAQVRADSDIAKAALDALRWHSWVPEQRVRVDVDDGWVTLSGEVERLYEATSAEHAVRDLTGVRGVTNKITVKPVSSKNVAAEITDALIRRARREATHITVGVDGATVTLSGQVDSLRDRDAAIAAAWRGRGVAQVIDRLVVSPP
jgi:osmotically-inducible protein OsmY